MNILKDNSPMDLNELKGQTSLSNKKWDKDIKGLTKKKLARVEKAEEGLLVSLVKSNWNNDLKGLNHPVGAFLSLGCNLFC